MAQTRTLSIKVKTREMENDLIEIEKYLTALKKQVSFLKKHLGKKTDLISHQNNIKTATIVDTMTLRIQNLINRIANGSVFIQHQLMLTVNEK